MVKEKKKMEEGESRAEPKAKPAAVIPRNKKIALDKFVSEVQKRLGNDVLGIYLFGSTAKGTARAESDIDVLVIYTGLDERKLLEITSEISFEIGLTYEVSIETITMTREEYEKELGKSPFLWEVLTFGKPIFTTLHATHWELDFKDYLNLATEYLNYAKGALQRNEPRLSIDAGYNAVEILVKALIISTQNPLAASHGGLITQFGKLFVLTNKVNSEVGKGLKLGLELRAKARYKPRADLASQDARFVIDLAEKLINIAEKELGK